MDEEPGHDALAYLGPDAIEELKGFLVAWVSWEKGWSGDVARFGKKWGKRADLVEDEEIGHRWMGEVGQDWKKGERLDEGFERAYIHEASFMKVDSQNEDLDDAD